MSRTGCGLRQPHQTRAEKPWNYVFEYGVSFLLFTIRLLALFARNRYQIIHVHNMPDFLIFTALVPKLFGAKLILDIHDPMPEFYLSKYAEPHREGCLLRFLRWQEKVSCQLADEIITANANFKENLIKRGIPAGKITVVMNVPNPNIFKRDVRTYEKQGKRFTLLYPGTVAPRYGLEMAIRALPELAKKIPHIRLVIAGGRRRQDENLKTLVQQVGV